MCVHMYMVVTVHVCTHGHSRECACMCVHMCMVVSAHVCAHGHVCEYVCCIILHACEFVGSHPCTAHAEFKEGHSVPSSITCLPISLRQGPPLNQKLVWLASELLSSASFHLPTLELQAQADMASFLCWC